MTTQLDKITRDYDSLTSSPSTRSTLPTRDLINAIAYAKDRLSREPLNPLLKNWLTIIVQREYENNSIRLQLDDLRSFVDANDTRIIPAPVFPTIQVPPSDTVGHTVVGVLGSSTEIKNGVIEVKEALAEINPENLEKAITTSEKFIDMIPVGETQTTLRGIHGAVIFQILRNAGHNLIMKNGQVEIMPKPGTDVVNLQEKLQTLVNTGRISLDTIKMGILYSSPSFAKYAEMKKTKDANGKYIIDPTASPQDFMKYVTDLQNAGNKSGDIQSIIGSQVMLQGVNMQQAIKGFQDMGQIGEWIQKNPQVAQNAMNTGSTGIDIVPTGKNPSPSITPSEPNNTLTGKVAKDGVTGGHVTGVVGDASQGLVHGIGDLLSLGKGDPLATLGIGAALVYGVYKAFQKFGFLGGLGTLFGLGAMNNIEKIMGRFGVDVGDAAENGTLDKITDKMRKGGDKLGQMADKVTGNTTSASTPQAAPAAQPAVAPSSTIDVSKLSDPQKKGVASIQANKSLTDDIQNFPKKSGKQTQNADINTYLNTIHKDSLQNITLDKIIYTTDHDQSIFSDEIKSQLPTSGDIPDNASRYLIKRVLRSYIGVNTPLSASASGKKEGADTLETFKAKYPEATWKTKTLKDLINEINK